MSIKDAALPALLLIQPDGTEGASSRACQKFSRSPSERRCRLRRALLTALSPSLALPSGHPAQSWLSR